MLLVKSSSISCTHLTLPTLKSYDTLKNKTGASLTAVFLTPKSHFTVSSSWLLGGCLKTESGRGEIKRSCGVSQRHFHQRNCFSSVGSRRKVPKSTNKNKFPVVKDHIVCSVIHWEQNNVRTISGNQYQHPTDAWSLNDTTNLDESGSGCKDAWCARCRTGFFCGY